MEPSKEKAPDIENDAMARAVIKDSRSAAENLIGSLQEKLGLHSREACRGAARKRRERASRCPSRSSLAGSPRSDPGSLRPQILRRLSQCFRPQGRPQPTGWAGTRQSALGAGLSNRHP